MWLRILRGFEGNPRRVERTASLLARLATGSLLVLVVATWPLWSVGKSPQIPFIGLAGRMPAWLEGAALQVFGLSAVVATLAGIRSRAGRWSMAVSVLAIATLVLVDQQRLQPWAYQLVVLEIILVALSAGEAVAVSRVFVSSIYFFSALSKLDRSFFDAGGGQIVDGLLQCLGVAGHVANGRMALAGLFAVAELLIAVGLCWRRLRRFAWPASIVMHLALLTALGPWGAENRPAVLLWNVYFILQNVILYGLAGESGASGSQGLGFRRVPLLRRFGSAVLLEDTAERRPLSSGTQNKATAPLRWLVRALVAFVILFPLTQPFGFCDVWPAWAVYATGPERARVFLDAADRDKLLEADRAYVEPPRFEDGLCLVRIDRLSLDTCRAPLYPQNRFRLGIAVGIAERLGAADRIVVEVESAADRFTGARTSRQLRGRAAIVAELERYGLNGMPRETRDKPIAAPNNPGNRPSFSLADHGAKFDNRNLTRQTAISNEADP